LNTINDIDFNYPYDQFKHGDQVVLGKILDLCSKDKPKIFAEERQRVLIARIKAQNSIT